MASNGVYGTNIPALVTENDIEMFYSYSKDRNTDDINTLNFKPLDSKLLKQAVIDNDNERNDNILEGMYNLKLPLQTFNQKGFYTVYIKPKEIYLSILDIGSLITYTEVNGIIIDSSKITDGLLRKKLTDNNSLVGYRIIYFDENGNRQNYYRIITSNNKCEPVVQMSSNSLQKTVKYRYNESSSLVFITVTPSTAPSFKPNAIPFIGLPSQQIAIVNTLFEPIMLEIEMVDHDADTITTMLEGSQLRDLDNGLVTTFNEDNEIYAQHEHYTLKDKYTNVPIYEVKKNKENSIDFSQTIDDK